MMTLGGGRAIITIRAADRDRGGGTWAMGVRVGEARHVYSWGNSDEADPDENVRHGSLGDLAWASVFATGCCQWSRGFLWPLCFMWVGGFSLGRVKGFWDGYTDGVRELPHLARSGDAHEKSVDKLSVKEFREWFYIPYGVVVELMDGDVMSTEKAEDHAIVFSKEQFNAGLWFPLLSLFKEFLHFTQIPSAYIYPNIVRVLMGCNILSMLFNLDLTLLEAGLLEHPERPFSPNHSLVLPGPDKRGHIVEWVEKASFARLNKLFEITAAERHYETLLTARNLLAVVRESQTYIINILPRKLPKKLVSGEHYVLKDLQFYKEVKKADAQKRQTLLDDREGRRKEGTLRKAPGKKRSTPSSLAGAPAKKKNRRRLEVTIRESEVPPLPSVLSGPGHLASLNHSGPSQLVVERLALLAEETTSINQPGSPHPDADAAEASCEAALPLSAPPREEVGSESLVSCSSVQDDHPEESEAGDGSREPTRPGGGPGWGSPGATQLAETAGAPESEKESLSHASSGGNPFDDATCISASAFRYAELEEKLKRIPPGLDVVMPLAKMFEVVETVELAEAKSREETLDACLLEAEDEKAFLSGEVRQLWTEVSIEKKQREDLQLRLSSQKKELESEFAAEREELEADYQKQVDDMFFFGYRYCMKKHGIKRDVPSIPPGEEEKLRGKLAQ
ncbi:hypothetical protein CK203_080642 [Vitis vinifera]|uniref:Uncharacterized protein n=1 Tax=Vitis vinifera TaxID=29760 RepID=A0A438F0F9_VITVI|nr:hypothetical protein CK203_080642 [Vitis vinifera]